MTGSERVFSPLQARIFRALGEAGGLFEPFFLVGGTALARFYLGHRRSDDLDLFLPEPSSDLLERAARWFEALPAVAVRRLVTHPTHRRLLAEAGDGTSRIDLAWDRGLAGVEGRPLFPRGPRLPPLEYLAAAKMCALLGRSDLKDLVDLYALEAKHPGILAQAAPRAARLDGGFAPDTFAWAVAQVAIPSESPPYLLEPVAPENLRAFRDRIDEEWVRRALE